MVMVQKDDPMEINEQRHKLCTLDINLLKITHQLKYKMQNCKNHTGKQEKIFMIYSLMISFHIQDKKHNP